MAERNFGFEALVLRRWPIGETHRGVGFLTRERGALTAIAHGAAASKGLLKVLTTPVRRVRLKAYHDPVADQWKVIDLEGIDLLGGLSEDLDRSLTASLWSEILWRTSTPGQESEVFDLFDAGFRLLNAAHGGTTKWLNVLVLWRALEQMGLAPDFATCAECGCSLAGLEVVIDPSSGEPRCRDCAGPARPSLGTRAVDALLSSEIYELDEALGASLEQTDLASLTTEAVAAWERVLGNPLRSVRVFQGGLS